MPISEDDYHLTDMMGHSADAHRSEQAYGEKSGEPPALVIDKKAAITVELIRDETTVDISFNIPESNFEKDTWYVLVYEYNSVSMETLIDRITDQLCKYIFNQDGWEVRIDKSTIRYEYKFEDPENSDILEGRLYFMVRANKFYVYINSEEFQVILDIEEP